MACFRVAYTNDTSVDLRSRRNSREASELDCCYAQARKLLLENKDKPEALLAHPVEEKTCWVTKFSRF